MNVKLSATVTIPETVAWQQVGDEVVLLDISGGEYHDLNNVAGRMWMALDEHTDVAAAFDHLAELYEVDRETLRADLDAFIKRLVGMGLLTTP